MKSENPSPSDRGGNTKNALEWTVFTLSCLFVAGAIAFLAVDAFRHRDGPPDLHATVGEIRKSGASTIIAVSVSNRGTTTAAEVGIAVEATFPSGTKSADLTIDFVPRGGKRDGFVMFDDTGTPTAIAPRITGYSEP